MQPASIKRFDYLYLGALALYAVGYFLSYDQAVALIREQYAAAGIDMNPSGVLTGFFIFWIAVGLLLWWLISSKGSNGAKWVLIALFVLFELIGTVYSLVSGTMGEMSIGSGLSLLSIVLKGAAIFYLFKPDAKAWLEREKVKR